jgi:hypothetical protein
MTVNDPVMGFIAMALAITAILAVGTLIAADIIHIGSHEPRSLTREADAPQPAPQPAAQPAETPIEALVPLGSSLAAGSTLRANPGSGRQRRPTP